jgi:hypothetical protein
MDTPRDVRWGFAGAAVFAGDEALAIKPIWGESPALGSTKIRQERESV